MCIVAAVPVTLTSFMAPHIRALASSWRISVVTSGGGSSWTDSREALAALGGSGVALERVAITRRISPLADLKALVALWRLFRRGRFDLVQSITPKAGLLTMLAAWAARVPVRVHWFVGQVWATKRGPVRWLLKSMDLVIAACATDMLADSASQRAFLVAEGVADEAHVKVLGNGSVCGVDTRRFRPDAEARRTIRHRHGIADDAVVALYLGRLNRDKGLVDLADAARVALQRCPTMHLLIVGPDEGGMRQQIQETLAKTPAQLTFVDYTTSPEAYMAAADIFVLPSYREGFGATVIEAAACGVPSIGTSIYGLTDAIVNGETGTLVAVRDSAALANALIELSGDRQRRMAMGAAARARVERCFTERQMTDALGAYYEALFRRGKA
jgi:hypothetical protein